MNTNEKTELSFDNEMLDTLFDMLLSKDKTNHSLALGIINENKQKYEESCLRRRFENEETNAHSKHTEEKPGNCS
jgi:hypothetical protein